MRDIHAMRSEADVFTDLSALCRSDGYVHALAYLCFRDNIVRYAEEMRPEDMVQLYSSDRLIRTEISTLIGLMIQGDMTWAMPSPDVVQQHIDRTESLLKELHETFLPPMRAAFAEKMKSSDLEINPLERGELLREAIFYSGESAYSFQYRDFAPEKYAADDVWLLKNKGFSIHTARDVACVVARIQEEKLKSTLTQMTLLPPSPWSLLPGFTFSLKEVAAASRLNESTVEPVLNAFTLPSGEKNEQFRTIADFNLANAVPLLKFNGDFVLFQSYSLVEAVYESPFYWMAADKHCSTAAMQNRGRFTEAFCRKRLELVFGRDRVYANVDIFESKAKKVGEIDVLVLFGDRAIIVQAKSKRLTIEARKGNDGQIRDDFKKSVQDSYDQGLTCAQKLSDPNLTLVGPDGREITVPSRVTEIYILCVVSDHYPSLNFQARQFLTSESTDVIRPPLVLDVFGLDAMTEMLPSPLRFLSYVNRRANYADRLFASHELIVLSYHLKRNLWVKEDVDMVWLGDDISADLDVAMAVRRDGVPGPETPDGILTRLTSTALGRIVAEIEARPDPGIIDFGFLVLSLSENAVLDVSRGIQNIAQLARLDQKHHDLTIALDSANSGITVHCTDAPVPLVGPQLKRHCERRKYLHKAKTWFGVCVHPSDESLRFGLKLDYEWEPNARLDDMTRDMSRSGNLAQSIQSAGKRRKLGRNDPCPCGSRLKYKKCHGK